MTDADKLYELLEKIHAKKGLTRLQIAEYLGVSPRPLYRWTSGETKFPRMVFIALNLLLEQE